MIEAQLFLRALETFFDRPAQTRRAGELRQCGAGPREHEIVSALLRVVPVTAKKDPALEAIVDDPRQPDPGPVVEPDAFGAFTGGMCLPGVGGAFVGERPRVSLDEPFPGHEP